MSEGEKVAKYQQRYDSLAYGLRVLCYEITGFHMKKVRVVAKIKDLDEEMKEMDKEIENMSVKMFQEFKFKELRRGKLA